MPPSAIASIGAGALYFLILFATGWVLGPIRELIITPAHGRVVALLVEAPFLVLAMILAARWLVRRFALTLGARVAMGLIAVVPLLAFEAALDIAIGGLTPARIAAGYATPSGMISLTLYALFAAMPSLVARPRGR